MEKLIKIKKWPALNMYTYMNNTNWTQQTIFTDIYMHMCA